MRPSDGARSRYGICEASSVGRVGVLVFVTPDGSHLHLALLHAPDDCFLVRPHIHDHLILLYSVRVYIKVAP